MGFPGWSPGHRETLMTMQAATINTSKSTPTRTGYPHLFRLLHWVLPVNLLVGVLTGLSLHAIARPGWSLFSGVLPARFWAGQVHVFHLSAAVVFSASLAAVLYLYWRRKTRRRAIHVILLGGGLIMVVTGPLMIHPLRPTSIYWVARVLHAVTGLGVLPVALLWHLIEGLIRFPRLLVPAFHPWASPRWRQLLYFASLALLAACLILNVMPKSLTGRRLVAKRIPPAKQDLDSLPWDDAEPLVIELAGGSSFDKGRTQVTLQALHDGEDLFVRARWCDPTEDRRYMPWQKTDDGWKRLLINEDDESYYYEDKFSLIFPTQPDRQFETFGCAAYCHAGGGRPYGYKESGSIVDVWHWKATRTDPVGQVDDKHWWEVDLSADKMGRYGDPSPGGGYEKNVAKDGAHPKCLPATPWAVRQGGVLRDQAVPYDCEEAVELAATMPPGTIVPGIVFSPFEGDRGHVRCESKHRNGRWEVVIRRKLDTGSHYDVTFIPGRTHSFACAAFDHSSKRHAYRFSVYGLTLER